MKNYSFFILTALIAGLFSINTLSAQDTTSVNESPFSVSCDLMSRYVWRGLDFGGSPSIQPGLEFSKSGITIGTWGAFTTNLPGAQEADLYASYTIKEMVSITVTDYFFPDELNEYKYFEFHDELTGHVVEATLSFDGTEDLPLTFLVATNVWGADARKIKSDGTAGDIQYSTYAELGYSFKNVDLFLGVNLTDPDEDKGESGFYGDSYGITNFGVSSTKEIKITDDYSLPLTVSLITNPLSEKIYLVAGFSF